MIMMAKPRTVPRDAAMAVEWSGGQGVGVAHEIVVALHPLLVGEEGGVSGVVEVEVVVDAASAATTIDPVGFIVNWVTPALETDDP